MKVSEFRKDISNQFDRALAGEKVLVERGGVQFEIRPLGVVGTVLEIQGEVRDEFVPVKDELQVNPPVVIKGDWSSGSKRLDKKMKGVEPVEKIILGEAIPKETVLVERHAISDEELKESLDKKAEWKVCKHGSDPAFCKFAKPGKVCK